MKMKHMYVDVDGCELHARVWGGKSAGLPVVAWHGVSRNGSDFGALARALCGRHLVICPDAPGRGMSQWAEDPRSEYRIDAMAARAAGLLRALKVGRCVWVGTSMGGLVGMALASMPFGRRIKGLVVNDIPPAVPADAISYIREYLSQKNEFASLAAAESYFRETYAQFGRLTGAEWRSMTVNSVVRTPGGKWTTAHDPRVAESLQAAANGGEEAWAAFARIRCPILVLRGKDSALLTGAAARKMTKAHKRCTLKTFAGCGHAPLLNTEAQIKAVRRFVAKCAR